MSASITAAELQQEIEKQPSLRLIDVRRKADFERSPATLPGATWQDPEKIAEWSKDLPVGEEVVVYCVKGGPVSQSAAAALEQRQIKVRYLEGGILGWQADTTSSPDQRG